MLDVSGINVSFGQHRALSQAALNVKRGEIVVILGANGAGKSSLLKAIAGLVKCGPGKQVKLDGRDLSALPAHLIVESGLALVPEGRGVFGELTVAENLLLGANPKRARSIEAEQRDKVLALFPRLGERMKQVVRTMSGGEQQMVAIGRALMSNPEMLLLDEPSLGLAPLMTASLFGMIAQFRDEGLTVLLVEQKARQTLKIVDRAYLLETGRVVTSGSAEQLINDPTLSEAFLGGGH